MRRGDIYLVDLEPARGNEANKRRPVVIVSNDGANQMAEVIGRGVITVVPVTSTIDRIYEFQVLLSALETGLSNDSKAQAEQVRSVSIDRLGPVVGKVRGASLQRLDDALRLHLGL